MKIAIKFRQKRVALAGILLAAALVLSLVESLIPPIIPAAPYAKVGFANIVLIVALLTLGYPYAILIMLFEMCVHRRVFGQYVFACVLDSRRVCRVHSERTHFQNSEDGDYCRQRHFGHDSQLCAKTPSQVSSSAKTCGFCRRILC
ncbi:MAG: Gx transporter family protein [Clostridiales bacterium]|nr:MAG: Gx transporter family protein [Clostridiales bacterium]